MKAFMDSVPYDEKYNAARKLNPDEDEYYMHPVLSLSELYERKNKLNKTCKSFLDKTKDIREKTSLHSVAEDSISKLIKSLLLILVYNILKLIITQIETSKG